MAVPGRRGSVLQGGRVSVSTLDRIRGSHHIYRHRTAGIRINLQPRQGVAKPYQLRQVLDLGERYDLKLETEP